MRLFELVLIFVTFLFLLQSISVLKIAQLKIILPLLAGVLLILHTFFEGLRWQMGLVYMLILCLMVASIFNVHINHKIGKWMLLIFGVIALLISSTISHLVPVFTLPKTTGKFHVISCFNTTENQLAYKIWFPSEQPPQGKSLAYHHDPMHHMDGILGLPGFVFSYLKLVRTHAYPCNGRVEGKMDKKPLVIYSHGASSTMVDNTALLEEIASQGYIVVAVGHDFSFEKYGISSADVTKAEIEVQQLLIDQLIEKAVPSQVLDYKEIMRALKTVYPTEIDFEKVALIGHSLGGTTACSGALQIDGVKAVVNMDGPIDPKITEHYSIPLLYFSSFSPDLPDNELKKLKVPPDFYKGVKNYELESVQALFENNLEEKYWVRFKNANHLDFTDIPYMIPMMSAPDYDRVTGHKLKSTIVISFLKKELDRVAGELKIKDKSLEWQVIATKN